MVVAGNEFRVRTPRTVFARFIYKINHIVRLAVAFEAESRNNTLLSILDGAKPNK